MIDLSVTRNPSFHFFEVQTVNCVQLKFLRRKMNYFLSSSSADEQLVICLGYISA